MLGFGFSYGGIFMNHLGCKRAGYVKAISIGDGSYGGNNTACGRLPVLVTARTQDMDEKIAGGRAAAATWKTFNGCTADMDVFDGPPSSPPSAGGTPAAMQNCTTQRSCKAPGAVTFCEDTWFDPTWMTSWNHTVREPYRTFTYQWFNALP